MLLKHAQDLDDISYCNPHPLSPLEQYLSPFEQYPEIFTDLLPAELPHKWNSEQVTNQCNVESPISNKINSFDKAASHPPDYDHNLSVGGSPASLNRYYSPGPEPVIVSPEAYRPLTISYADTVYPMPTGMYQSPIMDKQDDTSVAMVDDRIMYEESQHLASPMVPLTTAPVIVARSDTDKAKLRRARNAEAARRSRRAKSRVSELEALVEKLVADNQRLVEENLRLKTGS